MSDNVKISDMAPGAALAGPEMIEMVQTGGTFRTSADAIKTFMATGPIAFTSTVKTGGFTVATLPAAGTVGRRAYVTDANATFTAGIGAVVAGGGANKVPVFDDGVNWRIG